MEKKISTAFTYMFKDNDFAYKFIILILLTVPSIYISYLEHVQGIKTPPILLQVLSWVTGIIASGYFAKCTHNIIFSELDETNLLPKWEDDFWGYFGIGFLKGIAYLLITIALIPASILIVPLLIFLFLTLALDRIFCTDFKMGAYFQWKKAYGLVKQNMSKYIKIALMYIPLTVILVLFVLLFAKTAVLYVAVPIVTTYYMLVSAYLVGIVGSEYGIIED